MGGLFPHSYLTRTYFAGSYFPPNPDEIVPGDEPASSWVTRQRLLYPPIFVRRDEDEAVALVLALV